VEEVIGDCRQLFKEEFYELHSLTNIIRVIKSRRMRWAGQLSCMGNRRGGYRVLAGKPEGK